MAKIKVSEKDVQASCLEYLATRKMFFFRLNNIPVFSNGHFRKMSDYTPKGLPDTIVVKDGKFIGLEFKGSSGKLSDDQVEISRRIILSGGDYYVIRSIDDLQKIGL